MLATTKNFVRSLSVEGSKCRLCRQARVVDPDCPRCILKRRWVHNAKRLAREHPPSHTVCSSSNCSAVYELEEDRDAPGTYYCQQCWHSWERDHFFQQQQQPTNFSANARGGSAGSVGSVAPSNDAFEVFQDPSLDDLNSSRPSGSGLPSLGYRQCSQHESDRQFGSVLSVSICTGDISPKQNMGADANSTASNPKRRHNSSWQRNERDGDKQQRSDWKHSPRSQSCDDENTCSNKMNMVSVRPHLSVKPPPGFTALDLPHQLAF
jgi:hypothetical protein